MAGRRCALDGVPQPSQQADAPGLDKPLTASELPTRAFVGASAEVATGARFGVRVRVMIFRPVGRSASQGCRGTPAGEQFSSDTLQPAQIIEVPFPCVGVRHLVHQTRGVVMGVKQLIYELLKRARGELGTHQNDRRQRTADAQVTPYGPIQKVSSRAVGAHEVSDHARTARLIAPRREAHSGRADDRARPAWSRGSGCSPAWAG